MRIRCGFVAVGIVVFLAGAVAAQAEKIEFYGQEFLAYSITSTRTLENEDEVRINTLRLDCTDIHDAPVDTASAFAKYGHDLVVFCLATAVTDDALFFWFGFEYQVGPTVHSVNILQIDFIGSSDIEFRPNEVKMAYLPVPNAIRGEPFMLWYYEDGVEVTLDARD